MNNPPYPTRTAGEIAAASPDFPQVHEADRIQGTKNQRGTFALFAAGMGLAFASVPVGMVVGPGVGMLMLAGGLAGAGLGGLRSENSDSDKIDGHEEMESSYTGLQIGAGQWAHDLDKKFSARNEQRGFALRVVRGAALGLAGWLTSTIAGGRALDATAPEDTDARSIYSETKKARLEEAKILLAHEGFGVVPRKTRINTDFVNNAAPVNTPPVKPSSP